MKNNNLLKLGLILLIGFILIQIITNLFLEIREENFYSFSVYLELFVFLCISSVLIIGLHKIQMWWKWTLILPLFAFSLLYLFTTFYFPFPNLITVKKDTEVLYVNSNNKNQKVIRQVYWTGVTGGTYNSDTIVVNEFSRWVRLARPARTNKIEEGWVRVEKVK